MPFSLIAILFLISAAISAAIGIWVLQMRSGPGSRPFGLAMLAIAVWTFFAAFELILTEEVTKVLCGKLTYIGNTAIPPLLLTFALEYTGGMRHLSKRNRILIWIIPILTLVLAFTNDFHYILWTSYTLIDTSSGIILQYGHSFYWYFYAGYFYINLLGVMLIFLMAGKKDSRINRSQVVGILIALVIPWLANILYAFQLIPISGLDPTPLGFALSGFIISWTIYRYRLFELKPFARQVVIENMLDGVIVVDEVERLVDVNRSALQFLNMDSSIIGQPVRVIFAKWHDLLEKLLSLDEARVEVENIEGLTGAMELQLSSIREKGIIQGKVLVIRDITKRRELEKAANEQRKLAEALRDSAAALSSTLNVDEVLDRILDNIGNVVPSDSANIAIINNIGIAIVERSRGYETHNSSETMKNIKLPVDATPTLRKMVETGEPVVIPDVIDDPNWLRLKGMEWLRSYAAAPIKIHGKVEGFIRLDSGTPGFYKQSDADRLKAFADQAALAIENARLFEETKKIAEELMMMNTINTAITSGLDLDALLRSLYTQTSRFAPIDCFYVSLFDEETHQITMPLYYENGQFDSGTPRSILDMPGITGYIIETKKTLIISDTLDPSLLPPIRVLHKGGRPTRSFVGVPLILRDRVVGVISMQSYEPYTYSDEQVHFLELLCVQATIAIENARLFSNTQQMAITDSVTGLHNRRHFFDLAAQEVERAIRYNRPLSVIMFDVDKFKQVNDTLGHFAGDQVLLAVASRCKHILRKIDIIGRYGGDEFAILLPESPLESALRAAERLQESIRSSAIQLPDAPVQITITQGISMLTKDNDTLENLMEAADRALIEAKQEGRDLIRVNVKNP